MENKQEQPMKIQMQVFAKTNCKKCYGRGYIGYNHTLKCMQPCTCLKYKKPIESSKEEKE